MSARPSASSRTTSPYSAALSASGPRERRAAVAGLDRHAGERLGGADREPAGYVDPEAGGHVLTMTTTGMSCRHPAV